MLDLNDISTEVREIINICSQRFATDMPVKRIIISDVPTGTESFTTVFESDNQTIYALCTSKKSMTLADVRRIIHGMGMEADAYLPPAGNKNYFKDYGRRAFLAAYPARKISSDKEMAYYQTTAPYNPALVRIAKVNGEIREYLAALQRWQKTAKYSYRRIKIK